MTGPFSDLIIPFVISVWIFREIVLFLIFERQCNKTDPFFVFRV